MGRKSETKVAAAKAVTALTTAYASGWSYDLDVGEFSSVALLFSLVRTGLTSLELQLSRSDDGITYYDDQRTAYATGVFEDDELTRAFSASKDFALLIDSTDARFIRVAAKRTAGSATDTLACKAVGGQ